MRSYPIPFNEPARMAAVRSLSGVRPDEDPLLNEVVEIVQKQLDVPTALVSIVDQDKQWFAARGGFLTSEMSKEYSICAHTIINPEPLVICDTLADPRFRKHPVAVEDPYVRFYAGAPIILSSGLRVGSLCAIDYVPREHPTPAAMSLLQGLARIAARALEAHDRIAPPANTTPPDDIEKAGSNFIDLIGHELRTPLTVIYGSLQLLEASGGTAAHPSILRAARKSAEHLKNLVESIIKFADVSTGELRLNEKICDLGEIVANVADLSIPGEDGSIKSIALCDDTVPLSAYIDRDQIELALNNLAINAFRHGGDDIKVGCFRDQAGNIELQITDDGELDEKIANRARHQPFVVGGNIRNRDTRGGLGLGLPLTSKIVELHGGEFSLDAFPDGTKAVIRLPAWREDAAVPS